MAPIVIDQTSEAQKALTKEFTAQMIKTIKINEYQTGKAVGKPNRPSGLIRTKLMPASPEPLVGKKHPQGLTYGKGIPTQEIVGELHHERPPGGPHRSGLARARRAGHTRWRRKISIANYQYAIGNEAKAPDLEELAAQIGFEAGKVIARDGKPLPEKKKKRVNEARRVSSQGPRAPFCCPPRCRPPSPECEADPASSLCCPWVYRQSSWNSNS